MQFDLRVLHEHARRLAVPLKLGRGGEEMQWREHGSGNHYFASAAGRLIIDGIEVPALGDLEFPLVQPGKRRANPAGRRQVDRQPVPAHGRNQPHVRRGQAGAGQVQPQGLRAGHADFRQDRAADVPAGAGQRHRFAGRSHGRLGGGVHAPVHAADAPPGLRGAEPWRASRRKPAPAVLSWTRNRGCTNRCWCSTTKASIRRSSAPS